MKHRITNVLYFSTDKKRVDLFWNKVDSNHLNYKGNGLFIGIKPKTGQFKNAADLPLFLQEYEGDLQSLHVIVDLEPLNSIGDSLVDEKRFPIEYIRDSVISYPEVQFLFDKHGTITDTDGLINSLFADKSKVEKEYKGSFPSMNWEQATQKLLTDFILFDWESISDTKVLTDVFYSMIAGRDNTFDFSNLRYIIKYWKGISLKVDSRNFSLIQDSRSENLIVCVEEEANQNIFNSYALYKNGFRVLPITSASELRYINNNVSKIPINSRHEIIVFRDFDLQFEDEGELVNLIRGYKYFTENDYEKLKPVQKKVCNVGWNDFRSSDHLGRNNDYWNNLKSFKIYFITRGPSDPYSLTTPTNDDEETQTSISDDKSTLNIVGMSKPISGLYTPFHQFGIIKRRFKETRQFDAFKTSRRDHNHSTPLDIYDMIKLMLRRAEKYYESRKFRLAALVSGEAIEVMNGFHQRLLIKAHFINFRSENAIAMDVIGGDERYLCKDTAFRIEMIQKDVERLYRGTDDSKYANQGINILNQIYNNCRKYCKDKEHFEAENAYISAMGHLNEGFPFSRIIHLFDNLHQRYLVRCEEELRVILNDLSEKIRKVQPSLFLGNEDVLIKNFKGHFLLKRYRRQYKKLSGQKWPCYHSNEVEINPNGGLESAIESPVIRVPQAELCSDVKLKLCLKYHGFSFFKRIIWQSLDNDIASFDGSTLCTHRPGTTLIIAKTRRGKELRISIVVKEKAVENDETTNKE